MRAIVADKPGGPDVLRLAEMEKPKAGPGEILVKVAACALNPVDYKIRMGYFSAGRIYPAIFGYDICGTVEEAGPGAGFTAGDEVYYFPPLTLQGGCAEYHVVDASIADIKPEGLAPVEAASMPLAGLTAMQALFTRAGLEAGETLLIQGAAGGVGSLAVQMARWKGARVIGTCSEGNIDFVSSLGAGEVIDYAACDVAAEVGRLTGGKGADVAFDLVGGESFGACVKSLGRGGRLVFLNAFSGGAEALLEAVNLARPKNLTIHCLIVQSSGEDMRTLTSLVRKGFVTPQVDQVISLEQVQEAHRRLETMHGRGKVVIDMSL